MKIAFEKKFLADVAGADVDAVGDAAGVLLVAVGTHGEAVDVDFHAVPVGGDIGADAVLVALDGFAQDAALGVGAVGEEVDEVVEGGVDARAHVVGEGDVDLLGGVELGSAEADVGEAAVGDDEVGVVDGDAVDGVGMDGLLVATDELTDGGGGLRTQKRTETSLTSHLEFSGEGAEGFETSAPELLFGGVGVAHVFDVSASGVLAGTPTLANHGSDFVAEIAEDSHFHFTHNAFVLIRNY